MKKFIALLRGINVGGKNKVSMPLLKSALEHAGFSDVTTYINSGNIIFSSTENDILMLQNQFRGVIADTFGLDIPTAVIPAKDLADALEHAPSWWNAADNSKHNAIFVIAPADAAAVIQQVGDIKPEYEKVAHHNQVIFWSAPIETFSHTRWSKIVGGPAYQSVTIRNANTTMKLLQLSK